MARAGQAPQGAPHHRTRSPVSARRKPNGCASQGGPGSTCLASFLADLPSYSPMRSSSAAEIDRALTFPALIDALADAFRGDFVVPIRHHHEIERQGAHATLLLMPAWTGAKARDGFVGVKVVSVFPENGARNLPSVFGTYLLLDGATGDAEGGARRHPADGVAHGGRIGARRPPSRPRRREPHGHGRRRRACPVPDPRPCKPAPDCAKSSSGTDASIRRNRSPRSFPAPGCPSRRQTDLESGGAGGGSRLLRHAFHDTARARARG